MTRTIIIALAALLPLSAPAMAQSANAPNLNDRIADLCATSDVDLEGKRLQLLREVIPHLSHIAVLWNPASAFQVVSEKEVRAAAAVLHLRVASLKARTGEDIEAAFAGLAKERPGALVVLADRLFLHNRARIMELAAGLRLPGVYAYQELVEAGGLMSFGPSYPGMHRRAAYFVDRILKGANPGDLPVERPEELVTVATRTSEGGMHYDFSYPLFTTLREINSDVLEIFAFTDGAFGISSGDQTERLMGEFVSGN